MAPAALAEAATVLPGPAVDPPVAEASGLQTAVRMLGVQAVFQHTKASQKRFPPRGRHEGERQLRRSGRPHRPCRIGRGHLDPRVISYGRSCRSFLGTTELNRQGPDEGPQYRSEIFTTNGTQAKIATAYKAQLDQAGAFKQPIATKVGALTAFYPAEGYHQDYATLHPSNLYIVYNDLPKIENLKRLFPDRYRPTPVLVTASNTN
jgi:peptide-methionine (S)-S-oxide reductase